MIQDGRGRGVGIGLLLLAAVLWSTAGLFVRAIDLDAWTTTAWRSLFSACSLTLIVLFRAGRTLPRAVATLGRLDLLAVVLSAISMVSYITALKLTSVANVMTVSATVPFIAAGIAYLWSGERIGWRVVWASGAAFAGVLVMAGGAVTPRDMAGNALALLMTTAFAVMLVMMRRYPRMNVALINGLASFLAAAGCASVGGVTLPDAPQLALLGAFGFVTTALAYLMFLTGGRYLPSGEAGLIGLIEVVLGPLWVWLAFAERPSPGALVGGTIVLVAVGSYFAAGLRRTQPAPL